MKTPGYNAVPVYIWDRDDVYMEDKCTQHEEDSTVPTDVKQKQDHEVEANSGFPLLRLSTSCYRYKVTFEKTL